MRGSTVAGRAAERAAVAVCCWVTCGVTRWLLVALFGGLRCGLGRDLWFDFGPVVGGLLGALELVLGLEARRHRARLAGQNLVMLDVERAQPALLAHGDG